MPPMAQPQPGYELIKVLADLFTSELCLEPIIVPGSQPQPRVFIYNQKWKIPPVDGMFICVGFLYAKPFGATLSYQTDPATGGLIEVQGSNTQETYTVEAFSRNGEARERMHEIPMALRSTACQQLAERHSFKVGFIPSSFVDASETEESAILNKYVATFSVLRAHTKSKPVDYFDKFENPPKFLITNP